MASLREAERLIAAGRVSVNGEVVSAPGARARSHDVIALDGRRLPPVREPSAYLVHKPRGVVTTRRDPNARRTVLDLVPEHGARLFPVGRLDAQSEGLVLLTDDGELAQALLHPSFGVARRYRVSVEGRVSREALRRLREGIPLDGRRALAREARLLRLEPGRSVIELWLVEGRRHQIRRMLEAIGHPVRRLVRTGFGPLRLGGLRPGGWRPLRPQEQRALALLVDRAAGRDKAARQDRI
jgi:23S rRNA pseudouridine2605 synthase